MNNAVSLTNALDGLAIAPVIIATLSYTLIFYLCRKINFADYLTNLLSSYTLFKTSRKALSPLKSNPKAQF